MEARDDKRGKNTARNGRSQASIAMIIAGAGLGGTERHVRSLIECLPERGYRLSVIACEEGPLLQDAKLFGARTFVVPRESSLSYVRQLKSVIEDIDPDIVHAHSGRLPCLSARWAKVPFVIETRHGITERLKRLYQKYPSTRILEAWKCRLADLTVTVCEADANWLVETEGIDRDRIEVVYNGLPQDVQRRNFTRSELNLPGGKLLGFIGRLSPEKAPDRMLDLVERLCRRGNEHWFGIICGTGPMEAELRDRADKQGIGPRLVWAGEVPDGLVAAAAFDVLCIPSLTEGIPYVLLESLQVGTPVLATPVGGIPEVLSGEPLAESCVEWDVEEWALRAEGLIGARWRRDLWSTSAQIRAEAFDEARMIEHLCNIYDRTMGQAADSRPSITSASSMAP